MKTNCLTPLRSLWGKMMERRADAVVNRSLREKKKAVIATARNSHPYDYGYLLRLEQAQIEHMIVFFDSDLCTDADSKRLVRYLSWMRSCLKIFLEDEDVVRGFYVNTSNASRFVNRYFISRMNNPLHADFLKGDLYRQKAFNLYHQLRLFILQSVWD